MASKPTLISSAVGGRKVAAPKAAAGARRRQLPPPSSAASPFSPAPNPPASAENSVAPPSPPPTQTSNNGALQSQNNPQSSIVESIERDTLPSEPQSGAASQITPISAADVTSAYKASNRAGISAQQTGEVASKKRKREAAANKDAPAQPSAKQVKRSSNRSNASVQAAVNEQEQSRPTSVASSITARATRSQARASASALPVHSDAPVAKRSKATATKTGKPTSSEPGSRVQVEDAEFTQSPITAKSGARRKKKKTTRRKNAPASGAGKGDETSADASRAQQTLDDTSDDESDPELHEIDPNVVTMYEIGGDKRHGKVSEREKRMAEIDWTEVARRRREAVDQAVVQPRPTTPPHAVGDTAETNQEQPPAESTADTANVGSVQFRVVNGQIVEDESSLTIDRQAQAEAEAAQTNDHPVEEENDLTARVNRTTYLNDRRRDVADRIPVWKSKSDPWSDEDTDRFYDALKMFGTDFYIISKMFAPKTRRQIKLKFVREERLDPARINAALLGKHTKPMDLEHYAREVGRDISEYTVYESMEQAEELIRASMAEKEADMLRNNEEQERLEAERKKEQDEREKTRRRAQSKKTKSGEPGATPRKGKKKSAEREAPVDAIAHNNEAVGGAEVE